MIRVLALALVMLGLGGCALSPAGNSSVEGETYLMHVVLVWLKQPGNQAHRQRIIDASRTLREIPGVSELRVGRVVESDRAVAEDSYDVALSMRFDNEAALDAYLRHPLHVATVERDFAPIMARFQVMDFRYP